MELSKIEEFHFKMFCEKNIKKSYQSRELLAIASIKKKYKEFCHKNNFQIKNEAVLKSYLEKHYFIQEYDKWFMKSGGHKGCIPAYRGITFIDKVQLEETKKCNICKKNFNAVTTRHKYCSNLCQSRSRINIPTKKQQKIIDQKSLALKFMPPTTNKKN